MDTGPILIVEDSDDDFYAMQRALGKPAPRAVVRCNTGSAALDYLFQRGPYTKAIRPALVLLDLNLPGTHGHTVLAQIKADAALRAIPVVIISTSNNPEDVERCYVAHAAGYVVKPLSYPTLRQALQHLCAYWFQTVTLP